MCQTSGCHFVSQFETKILDQHMSHYQPLHRYEHSDVLGHYDISSYEPPPSLLALLTNIVPS
jgi:hypothetical protein